MNVRHLATAVLVASAVALFACPKPTVTPPPKPIEKPTPPPIRVPEGCEALLGGDYAHALNSAYRYRGDDDGGSLMLVVQRPASDGGVLNEEDGGSFIALNRTPNGFSGITSAVVFTQRGTQCRVGFPTDLVTCFDGGIVLRAASSASVDETCAVPKMAAPSPRIEHRLLRLVPAAAPEVDAGMDGGVDAGESISDAGKTATDAG